MKHPYDSNNVKALSSMSPMVIFHKLNLSPTGNPQTSQQVRIVQGVQGQQIITKQIIQTPGQSGGQNFQQIPQFQQQQLQGQQQTQPQLSIGPPATNTQQTNKPIQTKYIISHQHFNQLTSQNQQQILQNQQNQNVIIVNQSPSQNQSQGAQPPQSPQQQLVKQNYIQQTQQSLDIDQNQTTVQQPQQQIIINQQQQQQVPNQQIVINQQVINPQRVQYLQQQQQQNQLQLNKTGQTHFQNQQIIVQQNQQQPSQVMVSGQTKPLDGMNQQIILQQQQQQSAQPGQQPNQTILIQQQPQTPSPQQHQQIVIQQQHWSPQSPPVGGMGPQTPQQQQIPQSPQTPGTPQTPVIGQQTPNQPTFIRAPIQQRPGPPGQWQNVPQQNQTRHLIHLDEKSRQHFMNLDPLKKAEYITKLQNKQRVMMRQTVSYQPRQVAPNVVIGSNGAPRPAGAGTQHIIVQSQIPPGLNQQQQVQW